MSDAHPHYPTAHRPTGRFSTAFAGDHVLAEDEFRDHWTDILRSDTIVHLALMASITAATFQGYLKDRIGGPIPYVLADLFFVFAAVFWFGGMAIHHAPFRAPGRTAMLLLAMVLVPAVYLLHPTTPLTIGLAGLRAWSEFPVGCLIALSVIRTPGQVRAYVGLIIVLAAITAAYGILQYSGGPGVVTQIGDLATVRHGATTTYYLPGSGRVDFRAFSTFSLAAAFGSFMVFGALLAAGIIVSKTRPTRVRVLCAVLLPLFIVGMTVSGTRAALLLLIGGVLIIAWLKRFSIAQLALVPILFGALHVAALLTAGRIIERYRSVILQEGVLWTYIYAPVTIATRALSEHPFGSGLGRTGVGVPFSMVQSRPGFFIGSDGDLGRAAVEMGIVGVVLLLLIVFGLLPPAARAARRLVGGRSEDLAVGIAPLVIALGAGILIGSPFAAAPHGTIWWFMLGALLKLQMLDDPDLGDT